MGLVSFFERYTLLVCIHEKKSQIKRVKLYYSFSDEGSEGTTNQPIQQGDGPAISATGNPFLDVPNVTGATEFKKGYVMRKCCFDSNGKKSIDTL